MKVSKEPIPPKMTPLRSRENNGFFWIRLRNEPYLFINLFLSGIIVLIFAYSAFFSPVTGNYPVACIHEKITGEPCASCGLSHSFSLIMRGEPGEAALWSPYGIRVFIFFLAQLIMRMAFSIYFLRDSSCRKALYIFDSVGSSLMFLITFWPFIRWIFLMLASR